MADLNYSRLLYFFKVASLGSQTAAARELGVTQSTDSQDAADMLALLLQGRGHQVDTAYDGASAERRVSERHYDLVFLDLGLPDTDGIEVARRIRSAKHRCFLVALTGFGSPRDVARTLAAGFDRHVNKPMDDASLGACVGNAWARRRYVDDLARSAR